MTRKADILARFSEERATSPLFLPDLTAWYAWHKSHDTLPDEWKTSSLPEIAKALGVPAWIVAQPWRIEFPGITISNKETEQERIVRITTPSGSLVSRWIRDIHYDWCHVEYPLKSADDFIPALELIEALCYVPDSADLVRLDEMVGDDGIVALEIPRRPYCDMVYDLSGGSQGYRLVNEPRFQELLSRLECKLQDLLRELVYTARPILIAPDDLDEDIISPNAFIRYLTESYRRSAAILHQQGQYLLVQSRGHIGKLLPFLAETKIDGLTGLEDHVSWATARQDVGADFTLWGGISQHILRASCSQQKFETTVQAAVRTWKHDGRGILGIAPHVPVDAHIPRLKQLPALIEQTLMK